VGASKSCPRWTHCSGDLQVAIASPPEGALYTPCRLAPALSGLRFSLQLLFTRSRGMVCPIAGSGILGAARPFPAWPAVETADRPQNFA
jgi:hypothetical protein